MELYESNKRFLGPYNPVSPCQNILRVIAVTACCPSGLGLPGHGEKGSSCLPNAFSSPPIFPGSSPLYRKPF